MAREGKSQPRSRYGSRPLKRVVVKEEFVALTGNHEKALILAQLEYWHARPKEIDQYLDEELERARRSGADITHTIQPTQGWIYKDAEELIEETMLSISRQTIRRRLKDLVDSGWVLQRHNPNHLWDQTLQYRLDLLKIRDDLRKIGYELQGWVLDVEEATDSDEESEDSEPDENIEPETPHDAANSSVDIAKSNLDIGKSRIIMRTSRMDNQKLTAGLAIPETTSEITTEKDLPSVYQSDKPAHESSPASGETGPTDRPIDQQLEQDRDQQQDEPTATATLEEQPTGKDAVPHLFEEEGNAKTTEAEEPHEPEAATRGLSPKEEADNATPSPEDTLRQQAEAIPANEVSEEAQKIAREVLGGLPELSKRDRRRVVQLAEHYIRAERIIVLRDASDRVSRESKQTEIRSVWRYLTKSCAEAEGDYSEDDENLLASLSGENASAPPEESRSTGYEWFYSSGSPRNAESSGEHRQHTPEPAPDALVVWEKVLDEVTDEINAPSLRVWFEGTVPVSLSAEQLVVSVPNTFAREYIESRFLGVLQRALSKHLSPASSLEIVVGVEGSTNNTYEKGDPK